MIRLEVETTDYFMFILKQTDQCVNVNINVFYQKYMQLDLM